jgi:hypothetical protein
MTSPSPWGARFAIRNYVLAYAHSCSNGPKHGVRSRLWGAPCCSGRRTVLGTARGTVQGTVSRTVCGSVRACRRWVVSRLLVRFSSGAAFARSLCVQVIRYDPQAITRPCAGRCRGSCRRWSSSARLQGSGSRFSPIESSTQAKRAPAERRKLHPRRAGYATAVRLGSCPGAGRAQRDDPCRRAHGPRVEPSAQTAARRDRGPAPARDRRSRRAGRCYGGRPRVTMLSAEAGRELSQR